MSRFGAVLISRAWPKREVLADFDEWQVSKHLIELTDLPGVQRASYYATRTSGIPQAWKGSGNRMAAYWAENLADLKTWMSDPGLDAAIEDGSRFFEFFNELDESIYTGNVYELGPTWPGDTEPSLKGCLLLQRFEVDEPRQKEFDEWVSRNHVPRLRSTDGIRWVQWGRAVRGLPVEYYNSPGNRLVIAELEESTLSPSSIQALDRALADSPEWDRQLNYVRREIDEAIAAF